MNAQAVNTVGGICELAGVVLAVRELVEVVEYRGGLGPLRSRYQRARDAILTHVRRLLGRPTNQTVHASGIAYTSAHAGAATIGVQAGQPTVQTAETLEDRVANLEQRLDQLDDQLKAERLERQRAIEEERSAPRKPWTGKRNCCAPKSAASAATWASWSA